MVLKEIFGLLALIIAIISFFPYLKDIFARKTTPHIYSWLVWAILQMTAAVAILQQNSFYSALGVIGLGLVSLTVFILSFKYGTKNITSFDTACLIGAFITIGIWIFTNNATISIILVTIIDFIGFLPTYRKVCQEPHSETLFLYIMSVFSNFFSLLSITTYSIESSLYVGSLVITNIAMVGITLVRRQKLSNQMS
jgi:hypothetical protein